MRITTITDARTFVENSGVADWDWGANASADGFAAWLFANRSEIDPDDYSSELAEYLSNIGENPADYGIARPRGRPPTITSGKRVNVYLNASSLARAAEVGDGNVSAGIREALAKS